MRSAVLVLVLATVTQVYGSHDWFGLDLCSVRKERMPPELDTATLPAPGSEGAVLVTRYCGQCHYAPGPGQHTAAEWPEVLERMRLLMELTARFGGLVRGVQVPTADEETRLSAYLLTNALKPLLVDRADPIPKGYQALCGDCHAAPDPASHRPADWPAVLARMESHRSVMGRPPAESAAAAQVKAFLIGLWNPAGDWPSVVIARPILVERFGPVLALGPFFLLALLGVWRWRRSQARRA